MSRRDALVAAAICWGLPLAVAGLLALARWLQGGAP